ncbi:MAG: cysteinyl-tRNA synthetase [Chloroflexota bacterium]|jgi:cysteinyl-tRNA synthetase|nr:cysteinyl-tRNA synthetase [Chloroflexota bacterium]
MAEAPSIQVFNTLGREKQDFVPRDPGKVSMYTCGVTVYRYAHVGNMRTYLMSDFWTRALEYLGLEVTRVQNITDVGHLQNDIEGTGEDRMMIAAQDEGKSPEEIADFYNRAFMEDAELLRIKPADAYPRATEFIPEMIELIQALEAKGLTYEKDGNVFYDVQARGDYPKLSHNTLDALQAGYRIEVDPDKRHPADFLLWKAGGEHRLQIWDSPWGRGFPGWHLECSAMSLKYFPDGFDIHTGGIDLVFPHHEDEIAQSEPVAGKQVVRYWIHGEHLQLDGRKMAKSTGNVIRITDLTGMGHDPLAFRFLYLGAKYRAKLTFSLDVMEAAERGLNAIRARASQLAPATAVESEAGRALEDRFRAALADDLDLPTVSALLQEALKADIEEGEKRALLEGWDRVLQLDLTRPAESRSAEAPAEIRDLARQREEARTAKDFTAADRLRGEIEAAGWEVQDHPEGTRLIARK